MSHSQGFWNDNRHLLPLLLLRCVPHSNAYQPVENGAPLCLVLHKSFSLAWGKKKKKRQTQKPKEDECMIQGFTAQIALGVFYSSTFPVFLSQAASPAGLALNPIPLLSLMSGCPHLIYLPLHFVLSFVHVHASPAVTYSLSLWPDPLIAFSILQYWVAFHHLAGGIKRCKIFSVR